MLIARSASIDRTHHPDRPKLEQTGRFFAVPALNTAEHTDSALGQMMEGPATGIATAPLPSSSPFRAKDERLFAVSGYLFFRGRAQQSGLSGNALLGGTQMALFADGPKIAETGGFALRPFARLTAEGTTVTPQEIALGLSVARRAGSAVIGAAIERRAGLSPNGRNAMAARMSAGLYAAIDQTPLIVSAYGQAGMVGIKSKDGFADGEVKLALSEGRVFARARPGVGTWAAIQPGASRIDMGPTLDIPVVRAPVAVTIRADWRFRVGGNAQPGSGPTLTVATGF